ncbi:hypothetical protein ACOKXV_15355, partial [Sporosarcina psychrophila]|uniref:hypothetical protein n=1 Tax=Sporosarcina psychrophila TaxID=1476 RepID=UPI003BA3854B
MILQISFAQLIYQYRVRGYYQKTSFAFTLIVITRFFRQFNWRIICFLNSLDNLDLFLLLAIKHWFMLISSLLPVALAADTLIHAKTV